MKNYYNLNILPQILEIFKVNEIIITGKLDDKINKILEKISNKNISYTFHESNLNDYENYISIDLKMLANFKNYDAIFLNDDPNWFTIYNELNIIKDNNDEFPLVFVCNNVFPHKRRDSYINPTNIPKKYLNEFSDKLPYKNIFIYDDYFHANASNTPKNGVLTAIEDFLRENNTIKLSNIKFIEGVEIIFSNNSINQIRWSKLEHQLKNDSIENEKIFDYLFENSALINFISQYNLTKDEFNHMREIEIELSENETLINDYKNKLELYLNEIDYKNSHIEGLNSQINLNKSIIENIESKLINRENEIVNLNNQIDTLIDNISEKKEKELNYNNEINFANSQIDSLKENISTNEEININLNKQLQNANEEINSLKTIIKQKNKDFKNKESELEKQISTTTLLKNNITIKEKNELNLLKQLKNIDAQLEEKINLIDQKNKEIHTKSNQLIIQKEKLFTKQNELNKIKKQYHNQRSKLDSKEYCINCYQEEINNNHVEIQYLKQNNLIKKLLSPFAYCYLLLKSNPKEILLNYKLYKAISNSKCFDIGYYLNNNEDLQDSKWCTYFSPELHYVCNGFNENRKFNKKYFNRNSKEELLNYILICNDIKK